MNASELTFGIEIETTVPASYSVGGYHSTEQAAGLPAGWKATSDSSIRASRGRRGCEFVSPVLKGADGVRQVIEVARQLNAMGAKVNESCGFHIHVGFDVTNRVALDRLVKLVGHFETAIFASTGTKRRERSNWCRGLRQHASQANATSQASQMRYHVLNLTNLMQGRKPTVEFRAFAGTLNIVKILGYVRMCLALVERACDTRIAADFQPKASYPTTDRKGGPGQSALCRLFYQIGWTKGRVKRTFGDLGADGPSLDSIKKELRRLAKQYDAEV